DAVKIPLEFRRVQAADLTAWNGDPEDAEFKKLTQSISTLGQPDLVAAVPVQLGPFSRTEEFDSFDPLAFQQMRSERRSQQWTNRLGWIAGATLLAVLSVGLGWWYGRRAGSQTAAVPTGVSRTVEESTPASVIVPSITGLALDEATAQLRRAELTLGTT